MNFLLVAPYSFNEETPYIIRPGICYVSAAMKRVPGINVVTLNLDLPWHDNPAATVEKYIKDHNIDVVLSGGTLYDYMAVKTVFKAARKCKPGIITVAGGSMFSPESEIMMDLLEIADIGIIGEGERTIAELSAALRDGRSYPEEINGLIFKKNGVYHITQPREYISDWSEIPWPDYEGFNADYLFSREVSPNYLNTLATKVHIATGRGCPFRCTFCYNSQGFAYRRRPTEDFLKELEYYLDRYKRRDFNFTDDLLATTPESIEDFCEAIIPYKLKGCALCLRVEGITERSARMVKAAGFDTVVLGLENACDDILKSMKKQTTIAQAERAYQMLLDAGVSPAGNLIFGDREDTMAHVQKNIEWRKRHKHFTVSMGRIILYPGSSLYNYAVESGKIKDRRQFIKDLLPLTNVSKMSDEEYANLPLVLEAAVRQSQAAELIDSLIIPHHKDLTVDVHGVCSHCNTKIEAQNIPYLVYAIYCHECRSTLLVPHLKPGSPEQAGQNILKVLEKHGKMAFWGVGGNWPTISEKYIPSSILDHPDVYLVDRATQQTHDGRRIYPPEIIAKHNITAVVSTAYQASPAYYAIINQARQDYDATIINLFKLQGADFQCP